MSKWDQMYAAGFVTLALYSLGLSLMFMWEARRYIAAGDSDGMFLAMWSAISLFIATVCAFGALSVVTP